MAAGYTSRAKLAGTGGSAGAITIGGAITQRPELFTAAHVSEVADVWSFFLWQMGEPGFQPASTR